MGIKVFESYIWEQYDGGLQIYICAVVKCVGVQCSCDIWGVYSKLIVLCCLVEEMSIWVLYWADLNVTCA